MSKASVTLTSTVARTVAALRPSSFIPPGQLPLLLFSQKNCPHLLHFLFPVCSCAIFLFCRFSFLQLQTILSLTLCTCLSFFSFFITGPEIRLFVEVCLGTPEGTGCLPVARQDFSVRPSDMIYSSPVLSVCSEFQSSVGPKSETRISQLCCMAGWGTLWHWGICNLTSEMEEVAAEICRTECHWCVTENTLFTAFVSLKITLKQRSCS